VILNPRRIKARGSRPAVEDDGATRAATHLTVPDRKEDHEVHRGGQLGSDMVHDAAAAAAHPSAAVVGMVAWDCEGEKDPRLMRMVRSA